MILRTLFIVILVSGLVWLRYHNEDKPVPEITLPSLSDASGQLSQKMLKLCTDNPEQCQDMLKSIAKPSNN